MAQDGTVIKDILEGVRWQEADGVVTAITRMFIVHTISTARSDDENVKVALQHTDIPQPGEFHPVMHDLVVTGRAGRAVSPIQMNIEVQYSLPGGSGFTPGGFVLSGGASVEQVETQIHNQTQPDGAGPFSQITVEHLGVVQGVPVSPFESRQVLRAGNLFQLNWPQVLVETWVNAVNSDTFQFAPFAMPRTWHVTDMTYNLEATRADPFGLDTYSMTISIRHNPDGWDPGVWFTDPETGRPPEGMNPGVGYKTVKYYRQLPFSMLFGP